MSELHYFGLVRHYRGLIAAIFLILVGGVAALSAFFLFIVPSYTATAKVSMLPTQSELAFSQTFVRSTSINPANLMSQTHIEYLISREVARQTIDRLAAQSPADGVTDLPATGGLKARLTQGFRTVRNTIRRYYNILNSGKHVAIDPYTDAVLTLQDSIEVEMIEGTYILEIAVSWDKPEVAAAAANILAEVYLERARTQADEASQAIEAGLREQIASGQGNLADVEQQINALRLARAGGADLLRVIDPAVPPIYPSFPKVVWNTLFAIVGAALLSAFVVVAADTFSGTVKTVADLGRVMPGRVLGSVKARGGSLRGDWRKRLAAIARRLHMHGIVAPVAHPVMVLGSAPGDGPAPGPSPASQGAVMALDSDADSSAVLSLVNAALAGPQADWGRPPNPAGPRDLGGAAQGFAGLGCRAPDWLVVGLRPGTVAEPELASMVAEWERRGVRQIFGVILR